eukprot:TRINITY_DN75106_c0_g1_i1.p1 TRINITY_DN75106_c0_g1~~TRINITY_DN75106_c0_g1_i1.p1  ORF type:complete len:964 (-),score=153.05 TRINITY_DN75106_c0_g1_i1:153-2702(-)
MCVALKQRAEIAENTVTSLIGILQTKCHSAPAHGCQVGCHHFQCYQPHMHPTVSQMASCGCQSGFPPPQMGIPNQCSQFATPAFLPMQNASQPCCAQHMANTHLGAPSQAYPAQQPQQSYGWCHPSNTAAPQSRSSTNPNQPHNQQNNVQAQQYTPPVYSAAPVPDPTAVPTCDEKSIVGPAVELFLLLKDHIREELALIPTKVQAAVQHCNRVDVAAEQTQHVLSQLRNQQQQHQIDKEGIIRRFTTELEQVAQEQELAILETRVAQETQKIDVMNLTARIDALQGTVEDSQAVLSLNTNQLVDLWKDEQASLYAQFNSLLEDMEDYHRQAVQANWQCTLNEISLTMLSEKSSIESQNKKPKLAPKPSSSDTTLRQPILVTPSSAQPTNTTFSAAAAHPKPLSTNSLMKKRELTAEAKEKDKERKRSTLKKNVIVDDTSLPKRSKINPLPVTKVTTGNKGSTQQPNKNNNNVVSNTGLVAVSSSRTTQTPSPSVAISVPVTQVGPVSHMELDSDPATPPTKQLQRTLPLPLPGTTSTEFATVASKKTTTRSDARKLPKDRPAPKKGRANKNTAMWCGGVSPLQQPTEKDKASNNKGKEPASPTEQCADVILNGRNNSVILNENGSNVTETDQHARCTSFEFCEDEHDVSDEVRYEFDCYYGDGDAPGFPSWKRYKPSVASASSRSHTLGGGVTEGVQGGAPKPAWPWATDDSSRYATNLLLSDDTESSDDSGDELMPLLGPNIPHSGLSGATDTSLLNTTVESLIQDQEEEPDDFPTITVDDVKTTGGSVEDIASQNPVYLRALMNELFETDSEFEEEELYPLLRADFEKKKTAPTATTRKNRNLAWN